MNAAAKLHLETWSHFTCIYDIVGFNKVYVDILINIRNCLR